MVVQRNREISVWGQATPGAEVKVEMAGHTGSAKAAEDGAWEVKLPPLKEGGPTKSKSLVTARSR